MLSELSAIVRGVGCELIKCRDIGMVNGRWNGSQFKADADMLAHKELLRRLKLLDPRIPVISEEDPASFSRKNPYCYWLIDPIDGTASFAQGFPGFVTQVALIVQDSPYLAAVYAPVLDNLYLAKRGSGSFLNGRRLFSNPNQGMGTLIDNYPEPRGITLLAYNDLNFHRYMECGSISLKICKVAEGAADLFFKNIEVRSWDLAAPQVILEEAGGFLSDIYGQRIDYASNFEKRGVVAAPSEEIAMRLVSWYSCIADDVEKR